MAIKRTQCLSLEISSTRQLGLVILTGTQITRGGLLHGDSDSSRPEWGLRCCISDEHPDAAAAAHDDTFCVGRDLNNCLSHLEKFWW